MTYDRSFAESAWKADYTEVVSLRDADKRIADQAAQIESDLMRRLQG